MFDTLFLKTSDAGQPASPTDAILSLGLSWRGPTSNGRKQFGGWILASCWIGTSSRLSRKKKVLNGMHPHLLAEEIPHGGLVGTTAQDCEEDDHDEGLEARAGNTGNATEEL